MDINFSEGWLPSEDVTNYLKKAAELVLQNESINSKFIEISVTFVTPEEIQDLNRLHRNMDSVTDVLSFPQYESADMIRTEAGDERKFAAHRDFRISLGDVVICREKVSGQAKYYGHGFERELTYLFTHSVLHLFGYDHEDKEDKAKMRCIENTVLDEIGLGSRNS